MVLETAKNFLGIVKGGAGPGRRDTVFENAWCVKAAANRMSLERVVNSSALREVTVSYLVQAEPKKTMGSPVTDKSTRLLRKDLLFRY